MSTEHGRSFKSFRHVESQLIKSLLSISECLITLPLKQTYIAQCMELISVRARLVRHDGARGIATRVLLISSETSAEGQQDQISANYQQIQSHLQSSALNKRNSHSQDHSTCSGLLQRGWTADARRIEE